MLLCILPAGVITAEGDIPIDEAYFPDANFRNFVLTGSDGETGVKIDTDGNGYLSPAEIVAVTNIDVSYMEIADLTGIEYFTALERLYCAGNQLTSLNLSANTILYDFYCKNNSYQVSSDTFDLSLLPGNFDVTKVSDWQGGSVLTFDDGSETVTYTYDCWNGYSVVFTLILTEPDPGDYDGDGEVNVQDAILTFRAAMGLITPSEQSLLNADMDNNGMLTVTDAIIILRKAMGLI